MTLHLNPEINFSSEQGGASPEMHQIASAVLSVFGHPIPSLD